MAVDGWMEPTPEKRRAMQRQRERDTGPEMACRRELHRRGLRYRIHRRPVAGLRRTIDIVFPTELVAVECRGCYWHMCPEHRSLPKRNAEWWEAKLTANVRRDEATVRELTAAGWELIVVWEHEDVRRAADRIEAAVRRRRPHPPA